MNVQKYVILFWLVTVALTRISLVGKVTRPVSASDAAGSTVVIAAVAILVVAA